MTNKNNKNTKYMKMIKTQKNIKALTKIRIQMLHIHLNELYNLEHCRIIWNHNVVNYYRKLANKYCQQYLTVIIVIYCVSVDKAYSLSI